MRRASRGRRDIAHPSRSWRQALKERLETTHAPRPFPTPEPSLIDNGPEAAQQSSNAPDPPMAARRLRVCPADSGSGHVRQMLDVGPAWRAHGACYVSEDSAVLRKADGDIGEGIIIQTSGGDAAPARGEEIREESRLGEFTHAVVSDEQSNDGAGHFRVQRRSAARGGVRQVRTHPQPLGLYRSRRPIRPEQITVLQYAAPSRRLVKVPSRYIFFTVIHV